MSIIYLPAPVPAPPPPAPPLPVPGPKPLPAPPAPEPINVTFGAAPVNLVDQSEATIVRNTNIGFGIIGIVDSNTVRATTNNDTVSFVGSPGIDINSVAGTKTITWSFNGVISISAGNGIQVNNSAGAVTVTNTGILAVNSGNGIAVATVNGNTTVTNTGILNVSAGNSINVVTTNGNATITNTFTETVYAGGNATGSLTPNRNNGTIQKFTLIGNITLNPPTNMAAGQSLTLILTQDNPGNRDLTANAAYLFAGGFNTLSNGAGEIDMLNIFYDGTVYYVTSTVGYSNA